MKGTRSNNLRNLLASKEEFRWNFGLLKMAFSFLLKLGIASLIRELDALSVVQLTGNNSSNL